MPVNTETEIIFTPPFGADCIGCTLVRKAKLPAEDKIYIKCFARVMESSGATMIYHAESNDGKRGDDQRLEGICQVKDQNDVEVPA